MRCVTENLLHLLGSKKVQYLKFQLQENPVEDVRICLD
jgi:hypothetical protein